MEFWVWNNRYGAWRGRDPYMYVSELYLAGRFAEPIAMRFSLEYNHALEDDHWPIEVLVPVTNTYLPAEAQRLVEEFVETGDRKVFDDAYSNPCYISRAESTDRK